MKSVIVFLMLLSCQNSLVKNVNQERDISLKRENLKKVDPEGEFTKTKREFEVKIKELNLENNISKELLKDLAKISFDSNFIYQDKLQELNSKINDLILDKLNQFLEKNDFKNFTNFINKLDLNYEYEFKNINYLYLVLRKFFSSYDEKYIEIVHVIRKKIFKSKSFKMQNHHLKILHKFKKRLKDASYHKSKVLKWNLMLGAIFKRREEYNYLIRYLIEENIKVDSSFKIALLRYSIERFEGSELLSSLIDYCVLVEKNYENNVENIKNIINILISKEMLKINSLSYLLNESLKYVIRYEEETNYSLKKAQKILETLCFLADKLAERDLNNILRKARFSSTGEMNLEIFQFFYKRISDKRELLISFLSNIASYDKKIGEEYKRFVLKALENFRGKFINSHQASLIEKIELKLGFEKDYLIKKNKFVKIRKL